MRTIVYKTPLCGSTITRPVRVPSLNNINRTVSCVTASTWLLVLRYHRLNVSSILITWREGSLDLKADVVAHTINQVIRFSGPVLRIRKYHFIYEYNEDFLQVILCAYTLVAGPRQHRSDVRPRRKAY